MPYPLSVFLMVVLVCLTGFLCYQNKQASAIIALAAFALCGCFGRLELISSITAGASKLEIKLRETQGDVEQLKQIASLLAQSIVDMDRYSGAIGGLPASVRDQHRADILRMLSIANVSLDTISSLEQKNREHDMLEYNWAIDRYVSYKLSGPNSAQSKAWIAECRKIPGTLTPDQIADIFSRLSIKDEFAARLLVDYRYFVDNGKQKEPQFWADRDHWPGNG